MKALDLAACSTELYEKRMAPIGRAFRLTAMELNILLFLANNPEYDTAGSIAKRRYLAKSHVSVSVRSLEDKGLLRKEYRFGDRRTAHLVLLPGAREIIEQGRRAQADFLAALTKGLTGEEMRAMEGFLDRIRENAVRELREA